MPRLQSGAATDRPEIINITLPSIPEVVWQQFQETHSTNLHKTLTTETHKNFHMSLLRHRNNVESQTSPIKETSPQVSGSSTEPFLGKRAGSTPVQSLNDSQKHQSEIQRQEQQNSQ